MLDISNYKYKKLSSIFDHMVADLTKGNCFRYDDKEIAERKAQAEQEAREAIKAQLDKIPKVKRDIAL